jgi:hypothetical protein
MERVKDISKIKVSAGYVLIKIKVKDSLIVTPDSKQKGGPQVDYAEVITYGRDIEDVNIGDIVIDFSTTQGFNYNGEQYGLVPRMGIKFLVERDNFNFDGILGRKTKRLTN